MTRFAGHLASVALSLLIAVWAARAEDRRQNQPGQFDFYVLALSWSPGFCATTGSPQGRKQCETGSSLGFVVHGLWPQNEQGYPTFCEPSGRFAPRAAVEEVSGLFPDDNLARYQWRKHGSCTGESPSAYFRAVRRARDLVQVPERLGALQTDAKVMPVEIERIFAAVNPDLRPDMIAVSCRQRVLQEVRICLDRDLRGFRQCPEIDRSGCRSGELAIPAVR